LNKSLFYKILNYIFLFFSFAIIGYIWETCLKLVQTGNLVNSGTLFGPWLPIYGMGGIAVLVLLNKYKEKPIIIFLLSLLVCTIIEYSCSCYLEYTKGIRWWDYSKRKFNINGKPIFTNIFKKIPKYLQIIICTILIILFLVDTIYSSFNPNTGEGITYNEKR